MKNKFWLGFCLTLLISIVCGCGLSNQDKNMNDKENLYDDNDKIAQEDNNYTYLTCASNRKDNDIEIKYSGFSGADTIYRIEAKEDTEITFNYDSTVDKGKFKVVLINPKNEVETILGGTSKDSKTIKLTKGNYSFKNIGANAEGKIEISIIVNSNVEITEDKK